MKHLFCLLDEFLWCLRGRKKETVNRELCFCVQLIKDLGELLGRDVLILIGSAKVLDRWVGGCPMQRQLQVKIWSAAFSIIVAILFFLSCYIADLLRPPPFGYRL